MGTQGDPFEIETAVLTGEDLLCAVVQDNPHPGDGLFVPVLYAIGITVDKDFTADRAVGGHRKVDKEVFLFPQAD